MHYMNYSYVITEAKIIQWRIRREQTYMLDIVHITAAHLTPEKLYNWYKALKYSRDQKHFNLEDLW
jgi:hypothetical protein